MKQFAGFIRKEIYHILRDRKTLLILFGMPVLQVILFGFALNNELKNASIVVLDNSLDKNSIEISNKMASSGYFKIIGHVRSYPEIEEAFKRGDIKMAVVFPPDFAHALQHDHKAQVQLIADATDINTATALTGYASSIIYDYQAGMNGAQAAVPLAIETRSRMIFNPHLRSVYIFIPGVISVVLMIISAMLTSMTLTREKENGTMEFLAISPLQPMQIVIGKVLPYLFLSLINCLIIVLLGYFIFDMPMNGSVLLLMVESLLYVFTALSLGILISTIAETQQTAMFASLMSLMMPSMLLSGFIFPVESMVWPLQWISKIIPASYFILIIKGIMIKGVGLEVLWKPTLVLLGMTTFFMFMSIRNLKKQYR